jgi:hypothetical protein
LKDVQPENYALVTRPDVRAAKWITENISADARFLVNSFLAYGNTTVVGSDGGWWLPLLAYCSTTLPPINYASEDGPKSGYREWINALTETVNAQGIDAPETLTLLEERSITHVYIGQRQGQVNNLGRR